MKNRTTTNIVVLLLFFSFFIMSGSIVRVSAAPEENELILPDSDSRFYSEAELKDLPPQVLCYAQNEIYARNGRIFISRELKEYFELQPWYYGTIEDEKFTDDLLNEYELENDRIISSMQNKMPESAYQLDNPYYSFDEIDRYISSRKNTVSNEYEGIAENLNYDKELHLLTTKYLEMDIPDEWEDHFGINNPSMELLEFYCILAHQQDGGIYDGVVCSLYMLDESQMEDEKNIPKEAVYLGEYNFNHFYFLISLEDRYDPEDTEGAALYTEMKDVAEEMTDMIRIVP